MNGAELDRICNHPLLSPQEERDLGLRSLQGDEEARKVLVRHNLRLVASIAKGFVTNHNTLGDCIGIGVQGLIKAAERFDPDKAKFSTYATWWIKEALLKANWDQKSPLVRIPNWIEGVEKRVREGKEITEKEQEYLSCADAARRYPTDIYKLGDDKSPAAPEEDTGEYSSEYKELLLKAVNRLPRPDASLLKARFGLPPHKAVVTFRSLALVEGTTVEAIRQRQVKALEKLRAVFDDLTGGVHGLT